MPRAKTALPSRICGPQVIEVRPRETEGFPQLGPWTPPVEGFPRFRFREHGFDRSSPLTSLILFYGGGTNGGTTRAWRVWRDLPPYANVSFI